jgi:hypothetical protein
MKVVTYATHSEGTFEDIVGNQHGVKVDVLGFGTKWKGFMEKARVIYNYCRALPEDEIVVVIDGFDSEILKSLKGLEKTFRDLNCGVLLSKNIASPSRLLNAKYKKFFGTCKGGITANAGLYMGTAGHLVLFLQSVLNEDSTDDQVNFNRVCTQFDWVRVDTEEIIFYNKPNLEPSKPGQAYFKSTPGTSSSIQKYIRSFHAYPWYQSLTAMCITIIVLGIFLWRIYK